MDDVMDYVTALAKRAGGDKELVRQSIATFSHSPFQTLAYNQAAFDTGYMLNQLIGDGEGLIKAIKNTDGTWADLTRVLDDKMRKAVDYAFPSIKEMSKAADEVKELAKAGEVVDPKKQRLADAYKKFVSENPGVAKWSKVQSVAESIVRPINGALANSYFSLSYGYAFRNFTQNMFTLFVDDGVLFTKEAAIEGVAYFMAEIRIACNQCGEEFSFVGLPRGLSPREPMAGPFGLEARLPMVPLSTVDRASETFRVDVRPMDEPL